MKFFYSVLKTLTIILLTTSVALAIDQETKITASVIAQEAGGDGYEGMYRVANVIRNRAIKEHKTPYQIVIAPSQFAGLKAPQRYKNYQDHKKNADYLAENLMNLPDHTGGAIFFENIHRYGRPSWCKIKTGEYKNHVFYK